MSTAVQGTSQSSVEMYYRTKKVFENCSFTWTIENMSFVLLEEGPGFVMKSGAFPLDSNNKCKWEVALYPHGYDAQHADLVSVVVCLNQAQSFNIKTKCLVTFLDEGNNVLKTLPLEGSFLPDKSGQLRGDINQESLFEKSRIEGNDVLKIRVEISSAVNDTGEYLEIKKPCCQSTPQHKLIEDLSLMFTQQKLSDSVICVKGTEFQVHKSILAARCPVLAAMFVHGTKKKNQKRVEIEDVDPKIMQKLLRFIYTSCVEFSNTDVAMKILVAADTYALEDLKELCENYLTFNMNNSNVLDIITISDLHAAVRLKSKAMEFLCINRDSLANVSKCTPADIAKMLKNKTKKPPK